MKTCTFCGKPRTNAILIDASNYPHPFHKKCVKLFRSFLSNGYEPLASSGSTKQHPNARQNSDILPR